MIIAIAGLAESTSIMLFPLVLNSISDNSNLNNNQITNIATGILKDLGIKDFRIAILILIGFFFIIKGIFTFFAYSYSSFLRGRLIIKLKRNLLLSYSNMNYEYYLKNDIGNLVNIINEQTNRSVEAFKNLYDVGLKGINCLIYLIFAFSLSFSMGILITSGSFIIFYMFKQINISTKNLSIKTPPGDARVAARSRSLG